MKVRLYVETSVVSYLAARPSRDITLAARQQFSAQLWEATDRYDLVISDLVLAEANAGDTAAVRRRLSWLDGIPVLELDAKTRQLADTLIGASALPSSAYADALHIAVAATNAIPVIASWNFRHIASVWARSRIEDALRTLGIANCRIATPEELVEGESP